MYATFGAHAGYWPVLVGLADGLRLADADALGLADGDTLGLADVDGLAVPHGPLSVHGLPSPVFRSGWLPCVHHLAVYLRPLYDTTAPPLYAVVATQAGAVHAGGVLGLALADALGPVLAEVLGLAGVLGEAVPVPRGLSTVSAYVVPPKVSV